MDALTLVDVLSCPGADHPAVRSAEGAVSYVGLCNAADAIAAALVVHGIGPGDRVAAAFPEGAAFLAAFGGAVLARAAFAPLPPDDGEALRAALQRIAPRLILACAACPQSLRVAAAAAGIPIVSIAFDESGVLVDGEHVYDAHGQAPQPEDIVFIGPDGTPTTHGAVASAALAIPADGTAPRPSAPLYELRGLVEAIAILAAGRELCFDHRLHPAAA
jgi:acyl-CoA synthetase (AMP-forming)/AMP-acid ligase II